VPSQEAFSSSDSRSVDQHMQQLDSRWHSQCLEHHDSSSFRRRVHCQASTQYPPLLSASEISRGLTNMDLHLR